jgi:hypothetical protein
LVAPNQSATAHRVEIVERNTKFERYDVETVQPKACTLVGDIEDATGVDHVLTEEVHQHVAIDRCADDGAALDVGSRFPKRRHAVRFSHQGGKPPSRV